MARGQRDAAKERLWRRHLAAWRRSGQSIRAYCQAAGLSEPSFYAWRRVLAERQRCGVARRQQSADRDGADRAAASQVGHRTANAVAASAFVPVRVVDDGTAVTLEVVLRGGRVVRVPPGFAAQTLRAVVAALEDLPC
jgi:hypothetical protein